MNIKKILLVEDNAIILDNVTEILELEGYHVISAKNGLEGLKYSSKHVPDLIISDINMPLMNGYDMLKEIRTHQKIQNIPIVLLSVKNYGKELEHGLTFGANAYLCKPFDLTELLETVEKLLPSN